jgi:hypothetical protein
MITKQKLIEQINQFPEEFTIDELVERLILIDKVVMAEKQSTDGNVIPHQEAVNQIDGWFK